VKLPRPKPEWGQETRKCYNIIKKNFHIMPEHVHPVLGTCERHNRYYECKEILEKEGLTFTTTGAQIKAHPLLAEQKNAWAGYLAGLRILGLNSIEEKKRPAHRPPKGPGV